MLIRKQTYIKTDGLEILSATLPSVEEAKNLLTIEERMYRDWWWLRSPGYDYFYVAYVDADGSIYTLGYFIDRCSDAVRPILRIKYNNNWNVGDIFLLNNKKFKIISKDLAFCLEDIGGFYFNRTVNNNEYEHSDIKKYVDNWFNKAIKEEN